MLLNRSSFTISSNFIFFLFKRIKKWNNKSSYGFLSILENIIDERKLSKSNKSYVSKLFSEGQNRIIQKVGEEAVELLIESKDDNKQKLIEESADLLFHLLILLNKKNVKLDEIVNELHLRNKK